MAKLKRFITMMMVSMLVVAGSAGLASAESDVSGTVTDSNGNAVEGATVEIVDPGNSTTVATTTTDSSGAYSVAGLNDSQDYEVHVSANGYTDANKSFSTGAATSETVDFSLSAEWNTFDRPDDGVSHVYAEYDANGSTTLSVEAYNNSTETWETVVADKQYSVNGSTDSYDVVEVDLGNYTDANYTQFRVQDSGGVQAVNVGVAAGDGGGGGVIDGGGSATMIIVIVGALAAIALTGAVFSRD